MNLYMRIAVMLNLLIFSGGLAVFSLAPKFQKNQDEVRISAIHKFDKINLAKPGIYKYEPGQAKEPFCPPANFLLKLPPAEIHARLSRLPSAGLRGAPLGLTVQKRIFPFHTFL